MLLDTYLTDEIAASSRVFRVYRETPAHYHEGSDEYLYVLSGKGTFWMGDPSNGAEFAPGTYSSSNAVSFTRSPACSKGQWFFWPSTHRDAIPRTSSL